MEKVMEELLKISTSTYIYYSYFLFNQIHKFTAGMKFFLIQEF